MISENKIKEKWKFAWKKHLVEVLHTHTLSIRYFTPHYIYRGDRDTGKMVFGPYQSDFVAANAMFMSKCAC